MNDRAKDPERRDSPWLRADEAASYARCGKRVVYRAVVAGRLKAVRLAGRRELRLRREWVDRWLDAAAEGGDTNS